MGLLDGLLGTPGGGLLDFLRQNAMNQQFGSGLQSDQAQYSQPMQAMAQMPQAQPSPLDNAQWPFGPNGAPSQGGATLPPNAQPTQGQLPVQTAPASPQGLPPALGGSAGNILGRIGSPDGLLARLTGNDSRSSAQQNLKAQFDAYVGAGLSPQQAMIAVMNPKAADAFIAKIAPSYKAHNIGNTAGAFNEATGEFKPAFTDTKYEKLGPGDNLVAVGGPGGQSRTVATGGPEKPPAGYKWVDEQDPSKGVAAIPGGPGTHLPAETAGRIAMMETAAADLPKAREVLMNGRTSTGTGVSNMAGSLANAGEYARANRTVKLAIEGALRAMTGANAPEVEVDRYANLFAPGIFDSKETATQKLNQLDDFISNARRLVSQGRGPAGNEPTKRASDPLGIR